MKEVMKKAAEFKMPAVAMTDHGNLFGAIEFYQEAQRAGVKPIIGCEVYVAPGSHKDRPPSRRESAYHFTLLAENETGYRNLVKLVTAAHLDGFHYAPRIDKEMLAARSEGLIGLSGCLAGEINSAIQANNIEKAKQSAAEYRDILGSQRIFSWNCTITEWKSKKCATQHLCTWRAIWALAWSRRMTCIFCAEAITKRMT